MPVSDFEIDAQLLEKQEGFDPKIQLIWTISWLPQDQAHSDRQLPMRFYFWILTIFLLRLFMIPAWITSILAFVMARSSDETYRKAYERWQTGRSDLF